MSSYYAKRGRLYFSVKIDGQWKVVRSEFKVGQERAARAMLDRIDAKLAAGEEVGELGPPTVRGFSKLWLKDRKKHVRSWKNDDAVMRLHVLPTLGDQRIDEVRPLHLMQLVQAWRSRDGDERMAPRSVYTAYSTLCAFFRDAALRGLVDATPCLLTKRQLGPKVDADPEWRQTAQFGRPELEQLISDERVPMDRRVFYALCGVGGLRYGEASGLKFRNALTKVPEYPGCLDMLYVAHAYEHPLPKGDVCRPVPVHPTLAAMLAEWKLTGWRRFTGKKPGPDDLVVPLPEAASSRRGRWRRRQWLRKWLARDLEVLGLRHRRGHDLRRTFISLARAAGARTEILKRVTHKPPKEVIEGYTTFEWDVVCAEVLKLKVQRRGTDKVLALAGGVRMGDERLSTGFLPADPKGADQAGKGGGAPRTRTGERGGSADSGEGRSTSIDGGFSREDAEGGQRSTPINTSGQGRKVERKLRPFIGGRVRPFRKKTGGES